MIGTPITDSKGRWFSSLRAAAKANNVPYYTVRDRHRRGEPVEKIFCPRKLHHNSLEVTDLQGREFSTLKDAAEANGIPAPTVNRRYHKNKDPAYVFMRGVKDRRRRVPKKPITDHLGRTFESIKAAAEANDVSYQKVMHRLQRGQTGETAFLKELPKKRKRPATLCPVGEYREAMKLFGGALREHRNS